MDADDRTFGPAEERAIISLAFDQPEFFSSVLKFLKPEYFEQYETRFVFSIVQFYHEKHDVVLSRRMALDVAEQQLTVDDPHDDVIDLIKEELDPRDEPVVVERLMEWARHKQYAQLYSREALEAHERGDYAVQDGIIEEARRITRFGTDLMFFFDDYDQLFSEEQQDRFTTGFPMLDRCLNDGGPVRKDVLCFMAPTGVGKSIALGNVAASNVRRGRNVLHVSLEMTRQQVGHRYLGTFTHKPIRRRLDYRDYMAKNLNAIKSTNKAQLVIVEYPPDDVSVDVIHALIDSLRRMHRLTIDVVIIDYLELLVPRTMQRDDGPYHSQKKVSTEICRLAKKENVFVVTASQANRAGLEPQDGKGGDKVIDLNKTAESYGKNMPLSYVVTINQTRDEYESGRQGDGGPVTDAKCRFYVAKNRNGQKFVTVSSTINYETMVMREADLR